MVARKGTCAALPFFENDKAHLCELLQKLCCPQRCIHCRFACTAVAGADTLLALVLRLSPGGQPPQQLLHAILMLALEVCFRL